VTKNDLLSIIRIATDKAIIDCKAHVITIRAPQADLWKIYVTVNPVRPLGMSVEYKPMTLWQRLTTRGVSFHDWGF
jgi:hypothetical protein